MFNEEDKDLVVDEIVNNKDIERSPREIETDDSIEQLKSPQEFEEGRIIILDDLNEKELNDPQLEGWFKRSRQKNICFHNQSGFIGNAKTHC